MKELAPLLLLAALLLLFYLVALRPARRQQSAVAAIQRNLDVGDRVVLSAGIFGTIVSLDESRVHLEVAPGTVIEVARQVVVRRADDTPTGAAHTTEDHTRDAAPDRAADGPGDRNEDRPEAG